MSESGCPGPHGSPLVSQYALSALKRMIFYLPLSPICLLLVPQYALGALGLFPAFVPLALGALGCMILHLFPTCLLLVSFLCPSTVWMLLRRMIFFPKQFWVVLLS